MFQQEPRFIREVRVNYKSTRTPPIPLDDEQAIVRLIDKAFPDNSREHYVSLFLNAAKRVVAYSLTAIGQPDTVNVHPREIFQPAILCGASYVITAHNHPAQIVKASAADWEHIEHLRRWGNFLRIPLLDSYVITDKEFVRMSLNKRWAEFHASE